MTTDTDIPTLSTVDAATAFLRDLADTHEWVSVFWDRGWGDSGQKAEISIIVGGNGQQARARITSEVYRELRDTNVIAPNSLATFKARRVHNYKTPPPVPEPRVNPAKIAETVVRGVMAELGDQPIQAEFYRGLDTSGRYPKVRHEVLETRANHRANGRVLVLPAAREVAVSAQVRDSLGFDIIGKAAVLPYPAAGDDVDVDALAGDGFRVQLVAVIEDRLAAIAAHTDAGKVG